jgi:hypothetical protein
MQGLFFAWAGTMVHNNDSQLPPKKSVKRDIHAGVGRLCASHQYGYEAFYGHMCDDQTKQENNKIQKGHVYLLC